MFLRRFTLQGRGGVVERWLRAIGKSRRAGQIGYEISHRACPACSCLTIYLLARVLEKVSVVRFEIVREPQDLKAVAITDGPELKLVAAPDPARPTRNLLHGSIDARENGWGTPAP